MALSEGLDRPSGPVQAANRAFDTVRRWPTRLFFSEARQRAFDLGNVGAGEGVPPDVQRLIPARFALTHGLKSEPLYGLQAAERVSPNARRSHCPRPVKDQVSFVISPLECQG